MKSIGTKVIVKIEKKYEDEIKVGDTKLFFDPLFNPTQSAKIDGEIVSDDRAPFKKGDKCYFHFNVIEDSHMEGNLYNVEESRIFCVIRDGKIKMLNNWVLVDPIKEHDEKVDVNGKEIAGKEVNGIIVEIGAKNKGDVARIKHIEENDLGLNIEDVVYLSPHWEFMNEIEGKEYGTVRLDDIIALAHDFK